MMTMTVLNIMFMWKVIIENIPIRKMNYTVQMFTLEKLVFYDRVNDYLNNNGETNGPFSNSMKT